MSMGTSAQQRNRRHRTSSSHPAPLHRAAGAVVESLESRWLLSAGNLGTSFGLATAGFTSPTDDTATSVARYTDGKFIVAGNQTGTGDILVARYLPNGAPDASFGTGGKTVIDFGGADSVGAVAIDGSSIYLAGESGSTIVLAKLKDTGALDGVAPAPGINGDAAALTVSSDHYVYLGATATDAALGRNVFAVAKFDASGIVTTFGIGGVKTAPIGANVTNAHLTSLLLDGSNLIAGGDSTSEALTSFTLCEFDAGNGDTKHIEVTPFQAALNFPVNAPSHILSLAKHGNALLAIGASDSTGIAGADRGDVLTLAQYSLDTLTPDATFNPDPASHYNYAYLDSGTAGVFHPVLGGLYGQTGAQKLIVVGVDVVTSSNLIAVRYTLGGLSPVPTGPAPDGNYAGSGIASLDLNDPTNEHRLGGAAIAADDGAVILVSNPSVAGQGRNFGGAILDGTGAVTNVFSTDFSGPTSEEGAASVIDSTGRLIVAGVQNVMGDQHLYLVRFTSAGVPDPSFGINGVVDVSVGTGAKRFESLAVDAANNIFIAGLDSNGSGKVARYHGSDGTLDLNFAGGSLSLNLLFPEVDAAIRLATDGDNIVVAGTIQTLTQGENFYLMRYDAMGNPDGNFNSTNVDPHFLTDGVSLGDDIARAVVVLPDHTIIVGGSSFTGSLDSVLVKFDQFGAPLTSFGSGGAFIQGLSADADDAINALALQGTNIIAVGRVFDDVVAVARIDAAGALDLTFGTNGIFTFDQLGALSTAGGAKGVVVDSLGRIGLVTTLVGVGSRQLVALRVTANGALDTSFSGDGVASTGLTPGSQGDQAGIAIDGTGSFVITGTVAITPFNKDIGVERLPSATIIGAPATSHEGTPIALTASLSDSGMLDTATYSWTVSKNGNSYGTAGAGNSFTFTPNDNGSYVVTLIVTASDGGIGTDTKTITVTNVAPTATINGAPASSPAGTPINLTSTVADPGGAADPITYAWSVTRDGVAYGSGGTAANFSFTPADAASYIVTLTVSDGDGGSDTKTKTITVTAVTPPPLTVSATLSGGILTIAGDGAANTINVTLNNAGNYRVVVGTQIDQVFTFAAVNGILIQAGAGNDTVTIANGIAVAAEIHGGDGNDLLSGGGGSDMIFGEAGTNILEGNAGDDVVVGGAGTDIISGGNGRDILIGGLGSDLITGDNGDDILIAGATVHDTNPAGLASIRSIWSGGSSYNTRVTTLRANLLKAANIFNDTSIDLLSGNNGQDWLIANVAGGGTFDFLLGVAGGEIVTDI
jgi:uncharacterized delta-60 repeat protein